MPQLRAIVVVSLIGGSVVSIGNRSSAFDRESVSVCTLSWEGDGNVTVDTAHLSS